MLRITQGDAGTFKMRIWATKPRPGVPGVPMDLTAGTFETRIASDTEDGGYLVIPNGQHAPMDQAAPATRGYVVVTFGTGDSGAMKFTPEDAPELEILTIVTQAGKPVTAHGFGVLRIDRRIPRG